VATALAVFRHVRRKSIKDLWEAVREAEAELAAATKRRDAAAKRLMGAKEALQAAEEEAAATATRRAASRGVPGVDVS
jgi:chromosome segregation ATPase